MSSKTPAGKSKKKNVTVPTQQSPKRRRNRRRATRLNTYANLSGRGQLLSAFKSSLDDPFANGPVPLGYGTFGNTTGFQAIGRSTLTLTTSSFALVLLPDCQYTCQVNTTAFTAAPSWTSLAVSSAVQIPQVFSRGRIQSGGLRASVLLPATSAPGILYGGSFSAADRTYLLGTTNFPNSSIVANADPTSVMVAGATSMVVLMRPEDNASEEFASQVINGYGATGAYAYSIPYIIGSGFPIGTIVTIEYVLNLECTRSSGLFVADSEMSKNTPTLASYIPTYEALLKMFQSSLNTVVHADSSWKTLTGKHIHESMMDSSLKSQYLTNRGRVDKKNDDPDSQNDVEDQGAKSAPVDRSQSPVLSDQELQQRQQMLYASTLSSGFSTSSHTPYRVNTGGK